jgi:hypothetical protein
MNGRSTLPPFAGCLEVFLTAHFVVFGLIHENCNYCFESTKTKLSVRRALGLTRFALGLVLTFNYGFGRYAGKPKPVPGEYGKHLNYQASTPIFCNAGEKR